MSKFRQAYVKKTSPLFDGESIFKQLHHSSFGRFQSAVQCVYSLLPDVDLNFELPTVIVIGGRSAGKFSLLENITNCFVIPRHRDVCTKRPIKLQLKQVSSPEAALVQVLYKDTCVSLESTDDISGQVEGIMKDLNTITNDEIVIKICQVRRLRNPSLHSLQPTEYALGQPATYIVAVIAKNDCTTAVHCLPSSIYQPAGIHACMLFISWHKPCTELTQAVESKLCGELQTSVAYVQTDVPTIELLDLPGIQRYPPELYQQTTHLVNSYVNAPDTLVLCVVDVTFPSLDSSVATKAVRDANKLPRTILALTKADLIQDEESIFEQTFERVLGNSAETKDLAGLAACVAVVNRISQDHVTLIEAESAEQAIFSKLFADPAEAYAPPEVQKQLRSNTPTSQLIPQLDSLFHQHIVQSWTPSALTLIQFKLFWMQRKLARLGPAPGSCS